MKGRSGICDISIDNSIQSVFKKPFKGQLTRGVIWALQEFGTLNTTQISKLIGWKTQSVYDELRRLGKENGFGQYLEKRIVRNRALYKISDPKIKEMPLEQVFKLVVAGTGHLFGQTHPNIAVKNGTGPNKEEIRLLNILCGMFPSIYRFVGDKQYWVGKKNPDYINKSENKCIDYFGSHCHGEKSIFGEPTPNDQAEHERVTYFNDHGKDLLVVWDFQLKNNYTETTEKIQRYGV